MADTRVSVVSEMRMVSTVWVLRGYN